MTAKKGQGSLLYPTGGPIIWTPELLDALRQCIEAEVTVKETCRRLGMDRDALARGAMILSLRLLRGGLGDYGMERG